MKKTNTVTQQYICIFRLIRPICSVKKRFILTVILSLFLIGCETTQKPKSDLQPPPKVQSIDPKLLEPISPVSKENAFYIQKALTKLGYQPGVADGIWGPKSSKALAEYQTKNGLLTHKNKGLPSLHVLNKLETQSGLPRSSVKKISKAPSLGQIAAQAQNNKQPQLVFLSQQQEMLTKPNPFSKILRRLNKDTGIYLLGIKDGWIHIQTKDLVRGYIKN